MKKCTKCGEIKDRELFYSHQKMRDGRLSICKECIKAAVRANYRKNRDRCREYERLRAALPHRVVARKEYGKTEAGKLARKRAAARYLDRWPLKRAAHIITRNGIRGGKIIPMPCEVCGHVEVEAHHDDYSRPLDVRWLCKRHHTAWHKLNKPIYGE